ncbi:MAG: hypothetical protein JW753_11735 [Dehalococcoidia bacterium]|nr:hypothetical protein [Dehalococcoidia bacterium]
MTHIPHRYRATLMDCYTDVLSVCGDLTIRLELEFEERLDEKRLEEAIDLTLDAEPVLGCRFVDDSYRPCFKRLEANKRSAFLLANSASEYGAFKSTPIDHRAGPQINVCLWHSPEGDRLLLKVAHQVTDAAGVKDVVAILSGVYRHMLVDPAYRPSPNVRERRSLWRLLRHVRPLACPRILLNSVKSMTLVLRPHAVHTLTVPDGPRAPLTCVTRLITADRVSVLAEYGRSQNATLNDVFLAASVRALLNTTNWDGRSYLSLTTTIDMRRYMPAEHTEAVASYSTSATHWPDLGTEPGHEFRTTLGKVSRITSYGKTHWIGLDVLLFPWTHLFTIMPYRSAKNRFAGFVRAGVERHVQEHLFTNTGPIDPESVTFGKRPSTAHILPPQTYPPIPFDWGLSGYDGTLTLAACAYPTQKETIERFFDAVLKELPA